MKAGIDGLKVDPSETLLSCGNPSIEYFTRRELLEENVKPVEILGILIQFKKYLKDSKKKVFGDTLAKCVKHMPIRIITSWKHSAC